MTINHAGTLGKEYFISYIKLIMSACGCSVDKAKEQTFKRLFNFQEDSMGKATYQQFLKAYKELKE
ncbi:hypothetical protein ACTHO0_23610 [Cytobacillus praedii]|uniref:hypothetical protein n=1 Tax=Cytobacillus praedii TaxID=1742358 RepID=UPI002E225E7D|nr:hypothetical protein [Cytobacillus praedii]